MNKILNSNNQELRLIHKALITQNPIIICDIDKEDGEPEYILVFKALTQATLDQDLGDQSQQETINGMILEAMQSLGRITPFLQDNEILTTDEHDEHVISLDVNDRHVIGCIIPGGNAAIERLIALFGSNDLTNPFTYMEVNSDEGLIEILDAMHCPKNTTLAWRET